MHLLPPGASFGPVRGTPPFPRLPASAGDGGATRFEIAFGQDLSKCTEPAPGCEGLVAVNCTGLNAKRLHAAGFGCVRGFAAIPNLATARWFIPLDSPAASSAGFDIYSPTRMSARLKLSAVRLAARSGVPVWYRDHVWIVQRQVSSLERFAVESLCRTQVRLALSAGAPEPARNRKASAALVGLDGQLHGFAKISASPLAERLLKNEASVLTWLASKPGARGSVPSLIAAEQIDDRFVLLQTPVTGGAASTRLTAAHRTFLSALQSRTIRKPAPATALVADLLPRARASGVDAFGLESACLATTAALADCVVPSTAVHGDFTPWNIRQGRESLCCYDWEYGRIDGIPAVDETHHELQVGYLLNDWTVEQADRRLTEQSSARPGLSPDHFSACQNVYLIDVLLRLAEEGYTGTDPMVMWHRELLERRLARAGGLGRAA
jgi:hypothetical protein